MQYKSQNQFNIYKIISANRKKNLNMTFRDAANNNNNKKFLDNNKKNCAAG